MNQKEKILSLLQVNGIKTQGELAEAIYGDKLHTLHRLLTMSVGGYPFRPESDSYLRFSLACPIPASESVRLHYSNIPA